MRYDRRFVESVAVASAIALAACSGSKSAGDAGTTTPPVTTQTIAKNLGDGQTAAVATALLTLPSVKVTNASGVPVANVGVTFSVASGGGSITGAAAATDLSGVASVGSWTLGTTAGTNTLTATAAGSPTGNPVTFTATGAPGAPELMSKVAGDAQQGNAGANVPIAPSITLRDHYGNLVPNIAVTFGVASGGGSVTGGSTTTGTSGAASPGAWKLGNTPGANSLTATATGSAILGNPTTFAATGVVGPAATIAKVSGDNQSAVAGTAVAAAPTVRVTDAVGNNVNGAGVTFGVATGGGAVAGASQVTATDGTAKPSTWTLGATAGANTMTATAAAAAVAGSPLTFTATGTAGLNVATYAGTWSGTWTNATFGSTGTTSIVIAQGAAAGQVNLSHSGTGTVLGGSGAPLESKTNLPYSPSAFTLTTVSPTFGNVTLNVDAAGNITGSGTSVPNASIARWDCTGTINATQIRLSFTVTFAAGGTATGTIAVNKQ